MVNESQQERERSPSPQPCKHPKHPVSLHCLSCLIRARKIACCREYPCHKHEDADEKFWDAVDAHERLLERRRELKKQRKDQPSSKPPRGRGRGSGPSPPGPQGQFVVTPQKPAVAPGFGGQQQVSPTDSHRDEVFSSVSQGHRSAASSYMASDG